MPAYHLLPIIYFFHTFAPGIAHAGPKPSSKTKLECRVYFGTEGKGDVKFEAEPLKGKKTFSVKVSIEPEDETDRAFVAGDVLD
ncbi:MAG TPA: hypothetical protein P5072_15800, partial [Parvularculaceae bacterium]|nr:hypothetical protein [Parvularculaceae bacterium]